MKNEFEILREEREEKTRKLKSEKGHPLNIFHRENEIIKEKVKEGELDESFRRDLSVHYSKKGDLLYPLLKVRYNVHGPSDMMWTTDDEIKAVFRKKNLSEEEKEDLKAKITKMCTLEDTVLFTNCAQNFSEKEWIGVYKDMEDYPVCFGVVRDEFTADEEIEISNADKEIVLPGGCFTLHELRAMLNTIPLEITFVDANDINSFFNEGPKDFKRPMMALGRDVHSCHPPKIAAKVDRIITEFKNGTLDELPIWMERNGKTCLVKYMAVRDKENNYLGTLELVQDMGFAKEYFEKK